MMIIIIIIIIIIINLINCESSTLENIWKLFFKNLLLCFVVTCDVNPNISTIKTKTITVCRRKTKSK
jgi:hypothetical protein